MITKVLLSNTSLARAVFYKDEGDCYVSMVNTCIAPVENDWESKTFVGKDGLKFRSYLFPNRNAGNNFYKELIAEGWVEA